MNNSQLKLIQELRKMQSLDLKLMLNEYDRLYCCGIVDKNLGLHLIKRMKIRKGWKKASREQRRYAYNQIEYELRRRKEL